jgi:hypothetical protein
MLALDFLAERRIAEAVSRGEFDHLPGAGRPLDLEEDPLVPEEMRVAYRILKNAGYVPEEVRTPAERRMALLRIRVEKQYFGKVVARLGRRT